MGKATTSVIRIVHSEPRIAVRTPAISAELACALAMNDGRSQERKISLALGCSLATSASMALRSKIDSISDQLPTRFGCTTRSITNA